MDLGLSSPRLRVSAVKGLPFRSASSLLISGKLLLLLFRSRAITAITRDHPIRAYPRKSAAKSSFFSAPPRLRGELFAFPISVITVDQR
jgi:hypothetical protein